MTSKLHYEVQFEPTEASSTNQMVRAAIANLELNVLTALTKFNAGQGCELISIVMDLDFSHELKENLKSLSAAKPALLNERHNS